MKLKYSLHPNPLTQNKTYRAVIQKQRTWSLQEIIDLMLTYGTTVGRPDILSTVELLFTVIEDKISEGDSVDIDLAVISTSIKGNFEDSKDYFKEGRNEVNINITPGRRIKKVLRHISPQKVAANSRRPRLMYFQDVETGAENKRITPGNAGILRGKELKFDPEDAEQGLFLKKPGHEQRVQSYLRVKPSSIMFLIPDDLDDGEYTLTLRTVMKHTTGIRTGKLHHKLKVG